MWVILLPALALPNYQLLGNKPSPCSFLENTEIVLLFIVPVWHPQKQQKQALQVC